MILAFILNVSTSPLFTKQYFPPYNLFKLKNDKYILGKISNEIRIKFRTGLSQPDFDQNNLYAYIDYQMLENAKAWVGFGRNYVKVNFEEYLSEDILHVALSYDFNLTKKK